MTRNDKPYLSVLEDFYSSVSGNNFIIWESTVAGEGLDEIAMQIQESPDLAEEQQYRGSKGVDSRLIVEDAWAEFEKLGLMNRGTVTKIGEDWHERVNRGLNVMYASDMVQFPDDQTLEDFLEGEPGTAYSAGDYTFPGQIYAVLAENGTLEILHELQEDGEMYFTGQPDFEVENLYVGGFLENEAYEEDTAKMTPEAESFVKDLIYSPDGDLNWVKNYV